MKEYVQLRDQMQIRPARAEDRETVLAFDALTRSWRDHIKHKWDR